LAGIVHKFLATPAFVVDKKQSNYPHSNPKHKAKKESEIKRPRDQVVWLIQQNGRKEWKQQSGYHRRSLAETAFYRYKQLIGDNLSARLLENQETEALLSCHLLNKMTLEMS